MAEDLTGLTPGGADATYKWLGHFGAPGELPDDGDTPQPLYKGDGTPTPISVTETKLFVNGVEVVAGLTAAAIRSALNIPDYATLAAASAALGHNVAFYNTTTNRIQMTV